MIMMSAFLREDCKYVDASCPPRALHELSYCKIPKWSLHKICNIFVKLFYGVFRYKQPFLETRKITSPLPQKNKI